MQINKIANDHIDELLMSIIKFTKKRHQLLKANLKNSTDHEYQPLDLEVEIFSEKLNGALCEYLQNKRLVWSDCETIKFGKDGDMRLESIKDLYARELLVTDHDQYVEYQVAKLLENSLNQKVAMQLLESKKTTV